jgi:adenylate cyclase
MFLKRIAYSLAVAAIGLAFTYVFSNLKAISDLEDQTVDIREIAFAPETTPSPDIVMVWLDESTMSALPYRSPVPRDFLASLNSKISSAGAKLIAYDVFFRGRSFAEADDKLKASLAASNAYAVMPARPCPAETPISLECVEYPDEDFASSLKGIGLAALPFSAFDSTVRTTRFSFDTAEGDVPSFADLLLKAATGRTAAEVLSAKETWPKLGFIRTTPFLDANDSTLIRFAGAPGKVGSKDNAFKIYSAALVEKGLIPSDWLKDKIVMVGAAYDDATDAYLTPYYKKLTGFSRMNGVEIHANILSSLMTGQFYYIFERWQRWLGTIAPVVIISICAMFLSPLRSGLIFMALLALDAVFAVLVFRSKGIVAPIVLPAAGLTVSFGVGLGLRALTEGRQKRFIRGVFARYVPPTVVAKIIANPKMLKLGGEERVVTSMFTDIASFTTISEKLDPTTLVSFLNEYLGLMNDVLFKYGATLDKYEGDAIIAFFNAPIDVPNHHNAALFAAIDMKKASEEITKIWGKRTGRDIVTRIGINTGKAVVGNMGSEGRFDYTAIGDTINLASRLEGTNKFYGTIIMASEATIDRCDASILARPVDRVRVKGKNEPILLYEVMGLRSDVAQVALDDIVGPYCEAFRLFSDARPLDAVKILKKILSTHSGDMPSSELLKRCEKAIGDQSWDMVTDLQSK